MIRAKGHARFVCLWGGIYNPIIPVFDRPPKEWKLDIYERFKGPAVAKGYVRFTAMTECTEMAALRSLRKSGGLPALLLPPGPTLFYPPTQYGIT
jgi:hypothetical protein